jgi:hypothetical protein
LKPQTSAWFEAKSETARLLIQAGQRDEARKFLQYLKAVPPGWEQSDRREQFERLLTSVEKSR